MVGLAWYFNITPKNNRDWQDDVAFNVDYQQQNNQITVYNVRNFNWRTEHDYDIRWETRHYDLNQLQGVDLVLSTWGIDQISHTLLTFRFNDGQKLAFSIETRKEKSEDFTIITRDYATIIFNLFTTWTAIKSTASMV
ncbi:DUF4105 domain-containing protein [Acinetobacter sp. c1-l78]|uniref:lipoprotein N-acyltransferase Lnb domain-containing protein n=1 Tax=Acinetobacter sp. c1-l78 TaxID=3342803 RepID=UPI0035B8325F